MEHTLLRMNTLYFRIACFIVLCQSVFFGTAVIGQTIDSLKSTDSSKSMVFANQNLAKEKAKKSGLDGIFSINLGNYDGFHDHGIYSSVLQPNVGFEFVAQTGGPLNLLLGARIGIVKVLTTGISFGLRVPVDYSKPDLKIFTDLGVLFFDDAEFVKSLKYGVRLAFGARTLGDINFEYRLAGEWRGTDSDSLDGNRTRILWWLGAEVGIAFSLVGEAKAITRKDSLHAALHYIASGEEMDELDELSSDQKIDNWLERFWRIRDLTPATKLNESRIEFERRAENANRMFSRPKHLGVLSDPGRVMVIYGDPEYQYSEHSSFDSKDEYMVWAISGRVRGYSFATFLFHRGSGDPDWVQIYSNVAGEVTGPIPPGLSPLITRWLGM